MFLNNIKDAKKSFQLFKFYTLDFKIRLIYKKLIFGLLLPKTESSKVGFVYTSENFLVV